MKKNLDNFDDLVKNKLDGMDFSFNEANWEKASEMIDAARPAKKHFANLLVASGILLTGVLIVGSIYYFSSGSTNAKNELAQYKSLAQENGQMNSSNSIYSSLTNSSEEKKSVSTNNTLEQSGLNEKQNTSGSNAGDSDQPGITATTNEATTTKDENRRKEDVDKKLESENSSPVAGNKRSKSFSKNTKQNDLTPIGSQENAKYKSKSVETAVTKEDKQISLNSSPVYQPLENFNPENKTMQVSDANQSSQEQKELTGAVVPADIAQPDSSTSDFATKKDYVKMRHHTLFAEAGAINSFGWKANDVRNGNSVSPLVGINYMYHFTSKSALLVGVQYNSLANLSESNVSFSVTTFDFGMNNEITTYKVTGLQYLVAPVKYIHKLDKNNSIGVGLNMTYLMNVKNKIETYKSIESNVQNTVSKNDNGYGLDQLNRYNAQFAISYNRKLTKTLGVNFELNKSLNNVFKDYNYFGVSTKNSKPVALKLSLTYTLFNK